MSTLSDDVLKETVKALSDAGGNQSHAAAKLGLARSSFQERLAKATLRGLGPHFQGDIPPGLQVAGTSTYFTQGEARGQWIKTKAEPVLEDTIRALRESFQEYKGLAKLPAPRRSVVNTDLLTVYPLADLHLGMYAWAEETGADYDVDIARGLLVETMADLVDRSPPSENALLLNLGDFFHADNSSNQTERSHNALDVDTRYYKVIRVGVDLLIATVQLALEKHKHVLIRNLQGNHDKHAAAALTIGVENYFAGNPERVTVDTSPSYFFFHRFGKVLIGATHGDKAKLEDMPGIMAAKVPQDWGKSEYRYVYGGHWHRASKKLPSAIAGAEVEVLQTIAPKDAWNNSMGFTSGRSLTSITHHREHGKYVQQTINIKGPA